jgi:hypothetical protein
MDCVCEFAGQFGRGRKTWLPIIEQRLTVLAFLNLAYKFGGHDS